jgi:flagellar biosynthesis protein FlhA
MDIANQVENSMGTPSLARNSEIMAAVGVVGILILMILPLPSFILDLLLSLNITFALTILLTGTYLLRPLDFSSFPRFSCWRPSSGSPSILRQPVLSCCMAARAPPPPGNVIMAFGNFVVGGNYVVGSIVFIVLVIINLMVITKGSGRIGEVAARFTLDAMPGKQMSIDADLNAGLIGEEEAKQRRLEISQEADFYGAMDGASKFVKGDAIAGIIITLINILGGFAIGVMQNGMTLADAAQNYTLLTVGDGLVTQIPALMISTAAGIVVSRAGSQSALGSQIISQILFQPRAIAIAAVALFAFGLVPGMPTIPFMVLSLVAGGIAYSVIKTRAAESEKIKENELLEAKTQTPETVESVPPIDIMAMEVGYGLLPLVDAEKGGDLLDRIRSFRGQVAQDMGILLSPIHIQDNMKLKPGEYQIKLKGNKIAEGELMMNCFLAMNPGGAEGKIDGVQTTEPTYGLPAIWIKKGAREAALAKGYTVVDLSTVLITHLSDVIKTRPRTAGRQEVQQLLDNLKTSHPKVVEELIPGLLPLGAVGKILQNLLREGVPIRDLLTILETLADWANVTKDTDALTEYVRQALSRTITELYKGPADRIFVMTLDHNVEKSLGETIQYTDRGSFLPIDPNTAHRIVNSLTQNLKGFSERNQQPIVLCSAQIRPHFKKLADRFVSDLVVLSYDEIVNNVNVESIATVGFENAN